MSGQIVEVYFSSHSSDAWDYMWLDDWSFFDANGTKIPVESVANATNPLSGVANRWGFKQYAGTHPPSNLIDSDPNSLWAVDDYNGSLIFYIAAGNATVATYTWTVSHWQWNKAAIPTEWTVYSNGVQRTEAISDRWNTVSDEQVMGPFTIPVPPPPPVLTITGANPMLILYDATASYTDLGASAVDSADGTNLSSTVEVSGQVVNLAIIGTYTVTYTVTTTDGRSATATRTVVVSPHPTCFPAGTPIQTDQGVTAIEQLVPGEHTLRGKSIIAITQTRPLQKHIVCFEKDSIGKNVPSQQTLCSKEHKVLYQGEMIKARDLADMCKNVKKVSYNGETLYNVLLEKHGKMLVNNMICETLHPENIAAKFAKSKSSMKRNAAHV